MIEKIKPVSQNIINSNNGAQMEDPVFTKIMLKERPRKHYKRLNVGEMNKRKTRLRRGKIDKRRVEIKK